MITIWNKLTTHFFIYVKVDKNYLGVSRKGSGFPIQFFCLPKKAKKISPAIPNANAYSVAGKIQRSISKTVYNCL